MSWDVWLEDIETGVADEDSWNYTHNTNPMLALANGFRLSQLDKMSATTAMYQLEHAITYLALHREECEALNPTNGWGDYDGVLKFLQKIHARCKVEARRVTTTSNYVLKVSG